MTQVDFINWIKGFVAAINTPTLSAEQVDNLKKFVESYKETTYKYPNLSTATNSGRLLLTDTPNY